MFCIILVTQAYDMVSFDLLHLFMFMPYAQNMAILRSVHPIQAGHHLSRFIYNIYPYTYI